MLRIIYTAAAIKSMKNQPANRQARVLAMIESIAANPFESKTTRAPIKGRKDTFRQRLGAWRLLYRIDRAAGTVTILDFAPRGRAYR